MWVISGFFNAKALQEIARFAPKLSSLHIIIGKTTPSQQESQSILFAFCDPFDVKIKDFSHQLEELTTHQEALSFITNHNVKIYTLSNKNTLIHSKLYLLHRTQDKNTKAFAIIGSSNLTASGLGIYQDASNKELNLLCDSRQDTNHALSYFENLLNECQDASQEVQENLKTSLFYHAPVDVLLKLISLLPDDLEPLEKSEEDKLEIAREVFGLYDFQLIAAKELYKRLKAYSIAFLGDPVGAGKTLSALGVISLYKRVVVIAPKNLKPQWQSYITINSNSWHSSRAYEFLCDLPLRVKILSYYEATHPNDEQKSLLLGADLVVLDESHNYRNGAPKGSTRGNKSNQYTRLKQNLSPDSVLLCLSATIINNSLLDFANQIALAKDSLSIHSASINPIDACRKAQKALSEQAPLPDDYGYLTSLIFSRSSEEIINELKKLNKDMPTPKIDKNHLSSIPSNIDFSYEKLLGILGVSGEASQDSKGGITFSIYDPYPYLSEDIRKDVKESHLENLGEYTTPKGFICMSLLKALESSVDAFLQILEKIISYHENYLGLDSIARIDEWSDEDEYGKLDSSLPTRLRNLADSDYLKFLPQNFKDAIKNDLDNLRKIKSAFATYDSSLHFAKCAKFEALCDFIDSIPDIHAQKLLIFTESIPTTKAIARALQDTYKDKALEIATISGEDNPRLFNETKQRFSPKSQNYTLKDKEKSIDILVATDALSEG